MIVAFLTRLGKQKVDVSINGEIVSFTLPRDNWTIIDGVNDPSQIIGYNTLLKEGSTQVYAAQWSSRKTLPFGSGAPLRIMHQNGRFDSKTFDNLALTSADAIAERTGVETLVPHVDNSLTSLFDVFGAKMLELDAKYKLDNDEEALASAISKAQIKFVNMMYAKLSSYTNNHFNTERHAAIAATFNGSVVDEFMENYFNYSYLSSDEQQNQSK